MAKAFAITRNKGFHMTFANGVTVSVQFGAGTYSDNRDSDDYLGVNPVESNTAEVAAWLPDTGQETNWVTQDIDPEAAYGDDVIGFLSADEVLDFMVKAREFTPGVKEEPDEDE